MASKKCYAVLFFFSHLSLLLYFSIRTVWVTFYKSENNNEGDVTIIHVLTTAASFQRGIWHKMNCLMFFLLKPIVDDGWISFSISGFIHSHLVFKTTVQFRILSPWSSSATNGDAHLTAVNSWDSVYLLLNTMFTNLKILKTIYWFLLPYIMNKYEWGSHLFVCIPLHYY